MGLVAVPVRYPLTPHSRRTLKEAIQIAEEQDFDLAVLHVNIYQDGNDVGREELRAAVERTFGARNRIRYVIRTGFLVEETILEEVSALDPDVVVIGDTKSGRVSRLIQKLTSNPDIDSYLRSELDCEIVTVDATGR